MTDEKKSRISGRLSGLFKDEKIKKLIIVLGAAGIALIFISNFFAHGSREDNSSEQSNVQSGVVEGLSEYKESVEKSLRDIISKIEGAGRTEVFLTLDNGNENIYAVNRTENSEEKDENTDSSTKSEYFTVRNSDGSEDGMLLKIHQPDVRGVVVVCDGGDEAITKERVLEAVTKSLNISSAKVCITKLSQLTEE